MLYKVGGGCVMQVLYYRCSQEPLMKQEYFLNDVAYTNVLAEHLFLFTLTLFPSDDFFQQDNIIYAGDTTLATR